MSNRFDLKSEFKPTGDQPQAIEKLSAGLSKKYPFQTLLGVTGSGKTFSIANVIAKHQRPTLVLSHNKTLAAQLASEFQEFFPDNAVHYFVSYYDYYQPEAYIPKTDTYIDKETDINEEIDRLRHAATQALSSRDDVIIVSSVSCIYGLGNPEVYSTAKLPLAVGKGKSREEIYTGLVNLQYKRNDMNLVRGTFQVKGDRLEIHPVYTLNTFRVDFFGDEIEKISELDPLTGEILNTFEQIDIYPATHYQISPEEISRITKEIESDLKIRTAEFKKQNKLLELQRLTERTNYDLEMLREIGFCSGIENYSRYLSSRAPGEPPYTLMDFFPKDFLMIIDESHITIPQVRGMYNGDQARKTVLVDHGFRLPSALDNRPLNFEEFENHLDKVIFTSATPEEYELKKSKQVVEQIIRPTGLLDPEIEIKPTKDQVDDLLDEIQRRVKNKERVLVTTLTKKLAEELSEYLSDLYIKVHYLHSDIDTMERLEILRDLRLGVYDVVVGINLLREGLDLPEVSLVAILDADKEGFLRSKNALIQTMGRASRHINGQVIMYADKITKSMKGAMDEVARRRKIQEKYNKDHNITPRSIRKTIRDDRIAGKKAAKKGEPTSKHIKHLKQISKKDLGQLIKDMTSQMDIAAKNLEFEKAAKLRDQINELKKFVK